jgi:demethylmenaquinone methyltransferase/2-methoxy-6-polyprenyl-1,4-benzoquinol methylase
VASFVSDRSPSFKKTHARSLFAKASASYDFAGAALSFGQDPRWRRELVSKLVLKDTGTVCDVATGTGLVAFEIARRSGCKVVCVDQSPEMLSKAAEKLQEIPALSRQIQLSEASAEALPFEDATFDALTFTYLLRYVDDPARTLLELARVVKPGGTIASLEFSVPGGWLTRRLWLAYTRLGLPLAGRLISHSWYEIGRFLGPSISSFAHRFSLNDQLELWRNAGIEPYGVRPMSFGTATIIWGVKTDAGQARR